MAKKAKEDAMFRLLNADEIECRVGAGGNANATWCTLLLYKDARVDQRLLDEVVGPFNWKRSHRLIGDRLYCEVSIRDKETGEWVSKEDVGTESNTEKEKGQASDAFKRACFNWGIGRELYSAPLTLINLSAADYKQGGRLKTRFNVVQIAYDENREIKDLVINDNNGHERFRMIDHQVQRLSQPQQPQPQPVQPTPSQQLDNAEALNEAIEDLNLCTSREELNAAWKRHADFQHNETFLAAVQSLSAKYPKA